MGAVIEVLVLQALARRRGRRAAKRRWTRWNARCVWPSPRATSGCSPARATPMSDLLQALAARHRRVGFVTGCSKPWPRRHDGRRSRRLAARARPPRASVARYRRPAELVDPLSGRELDVLRLARLRPRRPGHRPRARRVAEHRAHPHPAHLRQARRHQPPRRRPPGPPAEPLLAHPPLTRPGQAAATCAGRPRVHQPLITGDDGRSSHRLLACRHQDGAPPNRPAVRSRQEEQPVNAAPPTSRTKPAGTRSASRGASTRGGRRGSTAWTSRPEPTAPPSCRPGRGPGRPPRAAGQAPRHRPAPDLGRPGRTRPGTAHHPPRHLDRRLT